MTEGVGPPAIYLDANPFIYMIEGNTEIARPVEQLMKLLRSRPGLGATSELTLLEVLPKARTPDHHRSYLNLILWSGIVELLPVSRAVLLEAANYRRQAARRRDDGSRSLPSLPDSIHIVTAIVNGCSMFVSNDGRLRLPQKLERYAPDATGIAALMQKLA